MFACPIKTNDLAQRVAAKLAKLPRTGVPVGYGKYTESVKDILAEIAGELFLQCYPYTQENKSEYLWDVPWWKQTEEDLEMVMACESEWIPKEVINDFQKLLVAKAPMKVLVTDTWGCTDKYKEQLDQLLRRYAHHMQGECYLWFDLEGEPNPGKLHVHEWHVKRSGSDSGAAFKPLPNEPLL